MQVVAKMCKQNVRMADIAIQTDARDNNRKAGRGEGAMRVYLLYPLFSMPSHPERFYKTQKSANSRIKGLYAIRLASRAFFSSNSSDITMFTS